MQAPADKQPPPRQRQPKPQTRPKSVSSPVKPGSPASPSEPQSKVLALANARTVAQARRSSDAAQSRVAAGQAAKDAAKPPAPPVRAASASAKSAGPSKEKKRGGRDSIAASAAPGVPEVSGVPEEDGSRAIMRMSDLAGLPAVAQRVKPTLKVSESGRFEDQFYHAHDGSRTMARLRNRAYLKKTVHMTGNDVEQFSDADIVTSGYLVKQGSFWKSWRRRFFVLRRDRPVLCYYTSAEELAKLGEMAVDENTTVQPSPKDGFPFRFTVENDGRKLTLFAEQGEEAMEAWISCINSCIHQRRTVTNGSFDRRSDGNSFRASLQSRISESSAVGGSGVGAPTMEDLSMDRASFSRMESPHQYGSGGGMNSMKRYSTDSVVIQQAANDSKSNREVEHRQSRNSRLTSVVSAPLEAARAKPRLYRSSSAGSILSETPVVYGAPQACDDNGVSMLRSPNHAPGELHVMMNTSPSSQTRAPSLSLPGFTPRPSVELAISVGSKAVQDTPQMLVALFVIRQGQPPMELSRTEMQTSLSLRSCGGDFYARDFNALLSVPRSAREMLQFEIFSVVNPASEVLDMQKRLGFVRISALDLLFSRDSTLVLECHRVDSSKQLHYLVMDRFMPPSNNVNVSHGYTYAKRHFLVDTLAMEKRKSGDLLSSSAVNLQSIAGLSYSDMVRGQANSATASHVLISEELSASYVSISMTVSFLKFLQRRNLTRIEEAQHVIHDFKRHLEMTNSSTSPSRHSQEVEERLRDVELEMAHYIRLHSTYQENEKRYQTVLTSLEEGREQGITGCLKRSNMKKDKTTAFMATNLNCHLVRGRRVNLSNESDRTAHGRRGSLVSTSLDESIAPDDSDSEASPTADFVYSVTTHGCATAHVMGYKEGGLRRLQQQLSAQKPPDSRLRERVEMREDMVRSQVLAIAGASFLNAVGLAASHGGAHRRKLQLACATGFLLSIESLLSTVGAEKGMLEDMSEGIRWLNNAVSFQLVQSADTSCPMQMSKCVGVTSTPTGDHVVAAFAVPPEVFAKLPEVLQQGHAIKLHGVLFTQGINEMQSVANHYLNSSLQDELNFESVQMLQRYFRVYQTQVKLSDKRERRDAELAELAELQTEIETLTNRLNTRTENVQKKFVNILIASSDICRRLGAGRTTCCKSGKDRTAMSVTLETSRLLVDHFHVKQGVHLCNAMRERGVRRVNVLANTGKSKFAFNSFQLKYIPDCYKPPLACADSHVSS